MAEPATITRVHEPDAEPAPNLPISALATVAVTVLDAARGLIMPSSLTIYGHGQEVSLQFASEQGSYDTIAAWAEMFGATLICRRWHGDDGSPVNICRASFDHDGTRIDMFAVIPVAPAAT